MTTVPKKYVLVLLTCDENMRSYGGFTWPKKGRVECQDWNPSAKCGNGLHGLLWGCGDAGLLSRGDCTRNWLVVRVLSSEIVDLGGKVKFPRGLVVLCTDRRDVAIEYLARHGAKDAGIVFRQTTAGDYGQATAGYNGQATAGDCGQATAGDHGQATVGDHGQATAGDHGQATAGDCGQATAGYNGQATVGDHGQATVGDHGQATAGDCGQATAGDYGQATAGYSGQATAGYNGRATAGDHGQATAGDNGQATAAKMGIIAIRWWDSQAGRFRLAVGYPGENGIKPYTAYRLNLEGKFMEVGNAD
jgi:hypothetical protein